MMSTLSLNPYSNGRYSLSFKEDSHRIHKRSLNPYSNGRYSLSDNNFRGTWKTADVLILILMEDTLWVSVYSLQSCDVEVLILILMEDTLWVMKKVNIKEITESLNPYSNGRYSLSLFED